MKRILCLMVIALQLQGPVHAGPAQTGPAIDVTRQAMAIFTLKPRDGVVPIVGAFLRESRTADGETNAFFDLFKGWCLKKASIDGCVVSSNGFVSGRLQPGEFEIDPLLRTAYLKITRKGVMHEVTWAGGDPEGPAAWDASCEDGPRIGAGLGSVAEVTGNIFGKSGQDRVGSIEAVAYAGSCDVLPMLR